jgi:ABC-type nitrate/sulfonate/bicarbonate transport system substrate-binding protein
MRTIAVTIAMACVFGAAAVNAERVRGAYPSANVQFLPAFVALEKGFYKREGLDPELISVRSAVTAVQALLGNQIHFIFSVGPQMPSVWEGADIILLAQMIGRPTFSLIVYSRDPKSDGSQRQKDRCELRWIDLCGNQGGIGTL